MVPASIGSPGGAVTSVTALQRAMTRATSAEATCSSTTLGAGGGGVGASASVHEAAGTGAGGGGAAAFARGLRGNGERRIGRAVIQGPPSRRVQSKSEPCHFSLARK